MTRSRSARRRALLSALLLAAPFALMHPAQADQLDNITAAKKIRIGVDLSVPPYGMKDEKLNSTGSDVDTARLIAKNLGLELEIVPTMGANRIPFLVTDKVDIVVSSFSITPERQKVIDFSTPYAAILAVVGAPKAMSIKTPADLVGKRIAVGRGSTNEAELNKIVPAGAQVVRFDDDATSITAVISGQADAFATAPSLFNRINQLAPAKQMETKIVMQANMLGIGLRKNEPALKARIDAIVKANLQGPLNEIYRKYHGTDLPADLLKSGD
ncbi:MULTISPECIES: transporter substrate-binding domain-containing protein [unclassified Variovorax]|uniref:transporter substrate-binding domain-containing protein n=1 Tax=unclassified Variovorax TaxID=663243 RepID=UPI0025750F64|nr:MULTISPECIES: transporter substrate-binding domain-containing protein [unclassified Variovorax]MDM0090989.1 transporter substrate-binding domain-containing protein [Variovorax sp. J22G40]MDM0149009.1 transporter substrate-binding domain-containing protein [Variovorax sp. J2P1-31]